MDAPPREALLAVDLGGTKITAALVTPAGDVGPVTWVASPALDGPEAVVAAIRDALAKVLEEGWGVSDDGGARVDVRGIGVASAGVVDVRTGTIVSSTDTFTDWVGTPLAAKVAAVGHELLGHEVPVRVLNDVDAHAVGETWLGAAAGAASSLTVAVGTGIGAGVVIDGHVLRGARHVAGEIGHVPIAGADHLRCPCGRPGHLEAIGSGAGLRRHYVGLGGDPAVVDGRGVVERAMEGDDLAWRTVRESAAAVGRGIAAVVTVLDPEVVVITGGVVGAGELWWGPMDRALRSEVIDVLTDLTVVPGSLGAHAALLGAARTVALEIGAS